MVKITIFALLLISCKSSTNIYIMSAKKAEKPANTKTEQRPAAELEGWKEGERRKRFRVQFDISYEGAKGKTMDSDSDTVPDLNLTVRQLLENHTRGKGNDVHVRQPLYMEFPIPNLKDITDVDEYKRSVEEQLANINQFIKDNKIDPETGEIIETEEPQEAPKNEADIAE